MHSNSQLMVDAAAAIADLSSRCNASAEFHALRDQLLAASDTTSKDQKTLSAAAISWLATGDRGVSAETIFTHLTGVDALRGALPSHPIDATSFGKCRKLLESCPEIAEAFHGMRFVSPYWRVLVPQWQTLCALMDSEAPNWRRHRGTAHQTFSEIKNLINEVRMSTGPNP